MTFRDLTRRARALFTRHRLDRELGEELSFHLDRETEKHIAAGLSPSAAREQAQARFGSIPLAVDQCRDARGTGIVDGAFRDIGYAVRMFRRAPFSALTIVVTVGLGLGLVAAAFTVLNVFIFRVDAVPDLGELFAVRRPTGPNARTWRIFTLPEYGALRRETSVFSDVFALLPDIDSRIDGRMMSGTLVTGNFFQVLGVSTVVGRTLTPGDDDRAAPNRVVVLSHRGWSRVFERDPDVIGRSLFVAGVPYKIVGVMPESFRGLTVWPPDYWAPLSLLGEFRPIHAGREDTVGVELIGRLKTGLSQQTATAGLEVWHLGRTDRSPADRRTEIIALEPRQGTVPRPGDLLLAFAPLFVGLGLVLMIGCANVANLLLARGVARQREIGIRLSLGASRLRIIQQLLTESLLLALASAALGFAVSRVVLEVGIHALMSSMAPEFAELVRLSAPAADWRVVLFLLTGAICSTVFFGLAPALQATRVELVRTMRGEVTKDPRPGRARNLLIGVQVAASALLLICASVFLRGVLAASGADSGLRTADTVLIDIVNEPFRAALVHAVMEEPSVASVAASWPMVVSESRAALAETTAAKSALTYKFVSPEYFDVLGMSVVSGRRFTDEERTGTAAVAVVSETTARKFWPNGNPLGQVLQLVEHPAQPTREGEPSLSSRTFTVVGITRDVAGFRFPGVKVKEAGVYLPTSVATPKTSLTVRVHGDPEQARRALLQRLTVIDPNLGPVMTMRTLARLLTYLLQIIFWLTILIGGLALVLTLSGLFSVLSYVVEQRTKEIGVRMALGATARNVAWLVLTQSLRPVGVGLVTGAGFAAMIATILMSTRAASEIRSVVHVFDSAAYLASLLLILTACVLAASLPALRAARIDPITTLRQD